MAFDADARGDAYVKALERWTLKIGGVTYVALPFSVQQAAIVQNGWAYLSTEAERRELIEGLLRRLFPWRLAYWWLGDPVKRYLGLPAEIQAEVVRSFFQYLARLRAEAAPKVERQPFPFDRAPRKFVVGAKRRSQLAGRSRTSSTTTQASSTIPSDGTPGTDTSPITSSGGTGA